MRISKSVRFAITAGLVSATVAAATFAPATAFADYKGYTDVPVNHWAVTGGVIDWADRNGIINGFPDGSWGVDQPVDRAQAAAILYNLAGNPPVSGSPQFSDADTLGWARDAAAWAQQQGIFTGTQHADGRVTFDPWSPLTREQAAKILCVLAGSTGSDPAILNNFSDRGSVSSWAEGVVAWAVQNGIMGNGGSLGGTRACTRGEFASMTRPADNRIMHIIDDHTDWVDDWDDRYDDWDDDWDDDRFDDDDDWDDDRYDDDWDDDRFDDDDDRYDDDWDDDRDDDDDEDRYDDDWDD